MHGNSTNITHLTFHQLEEGPQFAASILTSLAQKNGSTSSDSYGKYVTFIDLLNNMALVKGKNKASTKDFYLGWTHEMAASASCELEIRKYHLEKALAYFLEFIRSGKRYGEPLYYSYLASGFIMQALQYEWPETEESFLSAFESDPARGESLRAIIKYYSAIQQLDIAYIFSSYSKQHFLDQAPAQAKWGFEAAIYSWKVLDLHTAVCFQLGRMDEAVETFFQLLSRTQRQPELFAPAEIEKIQGNAKLFQQTTSVC